MAGPAPEGKFEGLLEAGNIDLAHRPKVKMEDGSFATVRSMSANFDGQEVLLPTVSQDGKLLSDDEAINLYRQTGQHLGKFDNPEHATRYAEKLHQAQEQFYTPAPKPASNSFWFGDADIPSNFTAAGGVAGLGEIVDAASKQMRMVENTTATNEALFQAYDDRIAAITAATGQKIENPLRVAERLDNEAMRKPRRRMYEQPLYADELKDGPAMPTNSQRQAQAFSGWLIDLEKKFPEHKAAIRADVPVEKDAQALAKKSDEDLARLMESRPGLTKFGAAFAGGFTGSLTDPLQVATLFAGGGAGAGRTVVARIANVALKEALVNGAVEAAFQPQVQAWREKAGLPHGWNEATANVLFAAAAGGVFGGGAEAFGAAARRVFTGEWMEKAAEQAKAAPLTPEIRKALDGDADAAIAAIKPIREALAPEARAAIDMHETRAVAKADLPVVSSPVIHDRNLDAAARFAEDPVTYAPDFELDRDKVDRIVSGLVPDAPAKRKSTTVGLQEFLIRAGGLQDQKGEITALGLQNASERFKGRLVRENGRTLDAAREIAAEAGFFNHRYGTAEEAVAKSTVADLLDELDTASRKTDAPDDDGGRSYVESRVSELMQLVGPEVDEKLIGRAVQRAEAEGIGLLEAFDREATEGQAAGPVAADQDAAANTRPSDPIATASDAVEPDAIDEDELFQPADLDDFDPDMTIPFFDDEAPVNAGEMIDQLETMNALFNATEACRI